MSANDLSPEEAEAALQMLAGRPIPWAARPAAAPAGEPMAAAQDHFPTAEAAAAGGAPTPALLENEGVRSLLEAVPDAVIIVGRDGRMVAVNGQAEKLFGYTSEEMLGRSVELLVPERSRAGHVGQRADYYADPHVRPMGLKKDLHARCKDGRNLPVEICLSPLFTGGQTLVVSTIRDISERLRARAHYKTLVEGIPAVTFMAALDQDVRELYVSPQIEALLGFTQKEWLEDPILWYTRLHPEDRSRWHEEFARTVATGEPFHSVYRFVARDGRVVWVSGEAKLVRDDGGRPLFLQGVAFDITPLKEAEEQLKGWNRGLEQRVAERTRELEERAGELERSNREKAAFSYFVAHELRKPLRRLLDDVGALIARRRQKRGGEPLQAVLHVAGDMMTRIERMLDYDKVGQRAADIRPTDCGAAFEAACDKLRGEIEASGSAVTTGGRRLPTVLGNANDLAQVFENLIGNAIKYRAARKLKVRVEAESRGGEWLFRVKDNGQGIRINPRNPEFIFHLFKRNHGEEIPGHGIGLAFCKKVIERHGGRIWVETDYGKGSTFLFTLPAAPDAERPQ